MAKDQDLFGKTFEQQVQLAGDKIDNQDIYPNRRIIGEVIFEPVLNGVRVTARDGNHRVLWGFIGSKEIVSQIHCPVAVYETLQCLLGEELEKHGLPTREAVEPIEGAEKAVAALQETLDNLKASITVKKVSEATRERAKAIARIASDADRMICLEASSFKGIKGSAQRED